MIRRKKLWNSVRIAATGLLFFSYYLDDTAR